MARSSQSEVASGAQPTSLNRTRPRSAIEPIQPEVRPVKKPRLSAHSQDKENKRNGADKQLTGVNSRGAHLHTAPTGTDVLAFMDNLLAGIDASVFENYEVSSPVKPPALSPVRSQKSRLVLSPKKLWKYNRGHKGKNDVPKRASAVSVKLEKEEKANGQQAASVAPLKSEDLKTGIVKLEALPEEQVTVQGSTMYTGTMDEKRDEFDDELFEFDLDFADLSAFDNDLLPKEEMPVRSMPTRHIVRYVADCSRSSTRYFIRLYHLRLLDTPLRHGLVVR
jgi:hypothetical protein